MTTDPNIIKKLDIKTERQKIINEVNDMAYLGPIRDIIKGMQSKECEEYIKDVQMMWYRATYLRELVNLSFKKIEQLENKG